MEKQFFVYILASKKNGTLCILELPQTYLNASGSIRISRLQGLQKKYNITNLVYYEFHENAENAITREKQLKKWNRAWKLKVIEKENPLWKDLYDEILQ